MKTVIYVTSLSTGYKLMQKHMYRMKRSSTLIYMIYLRMWLHVRSIGVWVCVHTRVVLKYTLPLRLVLFIFYPRSVEPTLCKDAFHERNYFSCVQYCYLLLCYVFSV